jgi:CheY-like chemotaxis protein
LRADFGRTKIEFLMVYLVDDDADDLEIVQEALIQNSYKGPVKTASNGQALMDDLNKNGGPNPGVIVLDLNMPLKNGFEVLKEIKSNPSLSRIPIVVLTASSSKGDEIRCMELGCAFYFRKPYTLAEYSSLVTLVKRIID